jgi:hypothetical protein
LRGGVRASIGQVDRDRGVGSQRLVRIIVDGRTIVDLNEAVGGFGEIDWSPDGSHLVLIGQPPDVAWALSLISLR